MHICICKVLISLITEVFLQCELLLEANSDNMDNYQDFDRYFINIILQVQNLLGRKEDP